MGIGNIAGSIAPGAKPQLVPGVSSPVTRTQGVEETQRTSINSSSIASTAPVSTPTTTTPVAKPEAPPQPQPQEPAVRSMSQADLTNHLAQLGKPITTANLQLISTMLQLNVPPSLKNVEDVSKLLKGNTSATALQSAVVAVEKGLSASPKSVDSLSSFLGHTTTMTDQLQALGQSLAKFQTVLQTSQTIINSGLMSGLSSIVGGMSDQVKKLLQKSQGDL